jgi:broad specificity phosphatase PhoE
MQLQRFAIGILVRPVSSALSTEVPTRCIHSRHLHCGVGAKDGVLVRCNMEDGLHTSKVQSHSVPPKKIDPPMTNSKIYIVRHAESEHNVSKDFSQLDPPLTARGFEQSQQLSQTIPDASNVAIILCSPLRRAIQTTLAGFSDILDKRYFPNDPARGKHDGASLLLEADLQERSNLPCDTGSSVEELKKAFPLLDFDGLDETWPTKTGRYGPDDGDVGERAVRVTDLLGGLAEKLNVEDRKDVVVVTHGVFMKFLTGDHDLDLPKAGWKRYGVRKEEGGGRRVLLPFPGE